MIKGTRNQLGNLNNGYQTNQKRVLAVCSAGLLRSPTIANVLYKELGYNTRSCGASDFALIPISEALIKWADEVILVNSDIANYLTNEAIELMKDKVITLSITDDYDWNEEALINLIKKQYVNII